MKKLYLITLAENGGAGRYVLDLALAKPAEAIIASGGQKNDWLFEQAQNNQLPVYYLPHLQRPINLWFDWQALQEIKKLLREIKPEIIHTNSTKAGLLAGLAAQQLGLASRVVHTVHGLILNEPQSRRRWCFYWLLEKITFSCSGQIICLSKKEKQQIISNNLAAAEKLTIIPNGLRPLEFLPKETARQQLAALIKTPLENKFIIGTLANLYPTKGLPIFIEALVALHRQQPDFLALIIGAGPEQENLQKIIKAQAAADYIFLLGRQPEAAQLLTGLDLYVSSSLKEGFPYSLLEAQAAGLPIVATAVGGVTEIITDQLNGWLVGANKAPELTQALAALKNNPIKRQSLAEQAVSQAKNFTLVKMSEQTEEVYKEVISRQSTDD